MKEEKELAGKRLAKKMLSDGVSVLLKFRMKALIWQKEV